jgi:hypothetical protein
MSARERADSGPGLVPPKEKLVKRSQFLLTLGSCCLDVHLDAEISETTE